MFLTYNTYLRICTLALYINIHYFSFIYCLYILYFFINIFRIFILCIFEICCTFNTIFTTYYTLHGGKNHIISNSDHCRSASMFCEGSYGHFANCWRKYWWSWKTAKWKKVKNNVKNRRKTAAIDLSIYVYWSYRYKMHVYVCMHICDPFTLLYHKHFFLFACCQINVSKSKITTSLRKN